MGYTVQGNIDISIFFDDKEYPLEKLNVLNFLHIAENKEFRLPTIHLSLIDQMQLMKKHNLLKDACLITVVVKGKGAEDEKIYKFRMFSYTQDQKNSGDIYTIDGYLDSVPIWLGRQIVGMRGSTSTVIANIANECQLKANVDATNDEQLWMPQNRTNGEFVKYLTKHGWRNDQSYMQSGVGLDKVLYYKDLNANIPVKHNLVYGEAKPGYIPVLDYMPSTGAGLNNATGGYKATLHTTSTGKDAIDPNDKILFTPNTTSPFISRDVASSLQRGLQRFLPVCFGNSNSNYGKAVYQNDRYASLLNYTIELTVANPTEIKMFDMINFNAETMEGRTDNAATGNYVVTGRVIYVEGARYYEKIIGIRHGTNL